MQGQMKVCPRGIVYRARKENWPWWKLQTCFDNLSQETAEKLLDYRLDVTPDGDLYEPGAEDED